MDAVVGREEEQAAAHRSQAGAGARRSGPDVGYELRAGLGAVGPPELQAGDAVVAREVEEAAEG